MTFLQTGVRLSELAVVQLEDVDFENRLLTLRQGKGRVPQSLIGEGDCRQVRQKGGDPQTSERAYSAAHFRRPQSGQAHEYCDFAGVGGAQEEGDDTHIYSSGATNLRKEMVDTAL
jgi:hypothetical protein